MPLIIVTGYPCSGKTYRASQLLADFESRVSPSTESNSRQTVTYLPSHHASLDPTFPQTPRCNPPDQSSNPRDQIYNLALLEKTARAEEFSAIKRALSKNNIVIADGLNYIKGFRYQLWCEAKAAGTRCVVVHTAARDDEVEAWNQERLKAWGWQTEDDRKSDQVQNKAGPKIGRDVMGDLMPEGHTAIYGDKFVEYNGETKSRSSSMGGGSDDEDDEESMAIRRKPKEDTMTLKSLYISNRPETKPAASNPTTTTSATPASITTTAPSPATSTPPAPTSSLPYSSATLQALTMRYEPPSPFTRWDTPLFTIPSADPHPDYASIWNALFPSPTKQLSKKALSQLPRSLNPDITDGTASAAQASTRTEISDSTSSVKPHAATILPKATGSNALQTLESGTADVVKHLLAAAKDQNAVNGEGGVVRFSVPTGILQKKNNDDDNNYGMTKDTKSMVEMEVTIPLNMMVTQPMLQRLRRKYTQIQRGGIAHGVGYVSGREDVIRGFVGFLEAEWEG